MLNATARLQFHAGFTMDDAVRVVPYLAALGISHLYASPLLKARPGSTHGYDIVDHNQINPELGSKPALMRLSAALKSHNMGLILDIVPNHMGVGGADNGWWLDVLEWGRASHYAEFFDIDWEPPDPALHHKILAPFLGAAYGDVLQSGDIKLQWDEARQTFYFAYHEHYFPLSIRSTALLLRGEPVFRDNAGAFMQASKASSRRVGHETGKVAATTLATLIKTPDGAAGLAAIYARYNEGTPESVRRLHELLERQHYRLAWWRAAADEINWRRFFDINTLAGVRVERPVVFEATHRLVLALYAQGVIDGVRIDHIDGLADPRGYARKLRRAMEATAPQRPPGADKKPYIFIEKILANGEKLPSDWLTDGTTGYDFMDQVSAVLHDPAGEEALTALWERVTSRTGLFAAEEEPARRQILRDNLASELNATASALHRIARGDFATRDYTLTAIRRALVEILVHFPVYRIYAGQAGRSAIDTQVMDRAMAGAKREIRAADHKLLDLLRLWLVDEAPRLLPPGPGRSERLRAMVRFQQLSAPVAAKSVEDTAFYRYGRLLSRNEVGSNPGLFAISPAAFHALCSERYKSLPHAMLATATHDHKRGEDTRARLAVLSEIPDEWERAVARWFRLNNIIRQDAGPSPADELMIYQTIVAAWPFGLTGNDPAGLADYKTRLAAWLQKSMREAKLHSEWAAPDDAYETASTRLMEATLDPERPVFDDIMKFAARIAPAGAVNSLSQTLLRLTAPGVPDLYQGTEFWDLSLVDPDNRRPVDFTARAAALAAGHRPADLLKTWQSGHVKQAVIHRALRLRQEMPDVFAHGGYQRLEIEGPAAPYVLAFMRSHRQQYIIALVTRLGAGLVAETPLPSPSAWVGSKILLPSVAWTDALNGGAVAAHTVGMASLFEKLPVALLRSP
jgi:(1->4)-alpha-D-glucan 1-alpha-D-glucosylmutase